MKQALQGLILKIKEKEDQCELRIIPNWVTFLQIDEDILRPTWIIILGSQIYKMLIHSKVHQIVLSSKVKQSECRAHMNFVCTGWCISQFLSDRKDKEWRMVRFKESKR